MTTQERYRRLRRERPLMRAVDLWRWAQARDLTDGWELVGDGYEREIDGFLARVTIVGESIYPVPGEGYGDYLEETRHDYDWGGQYPRPRGELPLGLPYTTFRYTGPGWVQGEGTGYFMPDGVADQYDYFRRMGQTRAVALAMTREWIEDTLRELFGRPLTNGFVRVTVYREDVELGTAAMGTDWLDSDTEAVFELVGDSLLDEAMTEARATLARLVEGAR